jgi:hypothetical protein
MDQRKLIQSRAQSLAGSAEFICLVALQMFLQKLTSKHGHGYDIAERLWVRPTFQDQCN